MIITTGDDYPSGRRGEFAVCFFLRSGASWSCEIVADRKEAEAQFGQALRNADVLQVPLASGPNQGRPSKVIWIAEYDGEIWRRVKDTPGATQHMQPDESSAVTIQTEALPCLWVVAQSENWSLSRRPA